MTRVKNHVTFPFRLLQHSPETRSSGRELKQELEINQKKTKTRISNISHSNRLLVYCTCVHIYALYIHVS